MLTTLSIRNVVLIEALDIDVQGGLSALTGETGAGKSILLDAMGLALGARADVGLVRKGAEQASVSASFMLPVDHPVFALLDEQDVPHEKNGALDFRRSLAADGRSKAFINDQPVGVGLLRQAGDLVVDIHGQFETHGLMNAKTHIGTLDAYAKVENLCLSVRDAWREFHNLCKERDALRVKIEQAREDQEYWQAAFEDLEILAPQEGEEDALLEQRVMLSAREQILDSFSDAQKLLDGGDKSAAQNIHRAWKILERVSSKAGERLDPALSALDQAIDQMRIATETMERWFDYEDTAFNSLEIIDDRLHALRAQARKHQCQVMDLPRIHQEIADRLNSIRGDDGRITELERAVVKAHDAYVHVARALSDKRQVAANMLDKKIMAELPPLKLDRARFETRITPLDENHWGASGMDQVQFVVATNPGAEAGMIDKIASGGELSRFMLAIKVVVAESSPVPVLVFDEVDAGIGGATADAVGECLARLAATGRQVLVITHSPQVAARAGHHFVVAKAANDDNQTRTTLIPINDDKGRREEIARMISGASITDEALAAAGKLLQSAS